MGELLPCPFCGSTDILYDAAEGWGECLSCHVDHAAWNRRADLGETVQRAWAAAEAARREAAELREWANATTAASDNERQMRRQAEARASGLAEMLRKRITECEQLRAERNRLLEAMGQAVHGHSGAGVEPERETTADAAGWGMW